MSKMKVQDATKELSRRAAKLLGDVGSVRAQAEKTLAELRKIESGFVQREEAEREEKRREEQQRALSAQSKAWTMPDDVPPAEEKKEEEKKEAPQAAEKPAQEERAPRAAQAPSPPPTETGVPSRRPVKRAASAERRPLTSCEGSMRGITSGFSPSSLSMSRAHTPRFMSSAMVSDASE